MKIFALLSRHLVAGLVISLACFAVAHAEEVEGTWQLVMRKLPDGTVQTPPTVYGMNTFKNGMSQLIVFWPNEEVP